MFGGLVRQLSEELNDAKSPSFAVQPSRTEQQVPNE
jgi:hypothetical protein